MIWERCKGCRLHFIHKTLAAWEPSMKIHSVPSIWTKKEDFPRIQLYKRKYFGQKFIHSITVALNCGIRWIHHTIFHNTVGLGDHQVKAMHQMMQMMFQSCLLDISIERTNLWSCGSLLGQILRPLLLVHLHQHPLFIRQVVLNVGYLSWNCPNWNYFLLVSVYCTITRIKDRLCKLKLNPNLCQWCLRGPWW